MIIAGTICDKCNCPCSIGEENDYGEIICDDCEQNAAERAWGQHCQSLYGGDGSLPLREQQIQARRLK